MGSRTTGNVAEYAPAALAPYIQHTLIETGVTRDRMIAHAEEAVAYGFNAAMVPGSWVPWWPISCAAPPYRSPRPSISPPSA